MLSLNQARVREMEVQLMSAILVGQEDSLQLLLDRCARRAKPLIARGNANRSVITFYCFARNDTEAI